MSRALISMSCCSTVTNLIDNEESASSSASAALICTVSGTCPSASASTSSICPNATASTSSSVSNTDSSTHGGKHFPRTSDSACGSNSSSRCLSGNKRRTDTSGTAAKKPKVGIEAKLMQAFEATQEDAETSFCLSLVDQLKRLDPCT